MRWPPASRASVPSPRAPPCWSAPATSTRWRRRTWTSRASRWSRPRALRDTEALHEAIGGLEPKPTGVYLHVDLDVLDSEEAPVNVYSAPGGLSGDQLEALVSGVLERHPVRAMSLTAYDPDRDPGGRVPPIAMRLLRVAAERAG